jgi:hypothetical protein
MFTDSYGSIFYGKTYERDEHFDINTSLQRAKCSWWQSCLGKILIDKNNTHIFVGRENVSMNHVYNMILGAALGATVGATVGLTYTFAQRHMDGILKN